MQSRTNMFFTLQTVSAFMWQVNWRVKQHIVTNALEMCRDLMPLVQKTISTARSWLVKNTFMPQSHLVGVVTYAKCCVDFFSNLRHIVARTYHMGIAVMFLSMFRWS